MPPLWGDLDAGRYAVGFESRTLRDLSRPVIGAAPHPAGLVSVSVKEAVPPPPTLVEAKQIVRAGGVDSLARVVGAGRARDSLLLTHERIADLFNWIGYQRDPDWSGRERLTRLRASLYPRSARAQYTLGHVLIERADTAGAIGAFREALRLLPGDDDPAVDREMHARIDRGSRDALVRLSGAGQPLATAAPPS